VKRDPRLDQGWIKVKVKVKVKDMAKIATRRVMKDKKQALPRPQLPRPRPETDCMVKVKVRGALLTLNNFSFTTTSHIFFAMQNVEKLTSLQYKTNVFLPKKLLKLRMTFH
jgi:hypothetical protein